MCNSHCTAKTVERPCTAASYSFAAAHQRHPGLITICAGLELVGYSLLFWCCSVPTMFDCLLRKNGASLAA